MKEIVAIIVPVYNEEENILPLLGEIQKAISSLPDFDFKVVFVNDGSTDNTERVIEQFSGEKLKAGYISLSRNFGHQAAISAGLNNTKGDIFITMDGDLEHPPELIPSMLHAYAKGFEVVQTQRVNTTRNLKGIISFMFYWIFEKLPFARVTPYAADFRLMSGRVVDDIRKMQGRDRLLRVIIPQLGYSQTCIKYKQPQRIYGVPKYTYYSLYELAIRILFSFTTFPANALLLIGTVILIVSMISIILLSRQTASVSLVAIIGLTALALAGLMLCCTGIIAWYLYFVLEQVRHDPPYVIDKKILN